MSFRDFFGVRHGGYRPKGDGHDGPKGPPPETGSGVQPPGLVPDAGSSVQIGPVGRVTFGASGNIGGMSAPHVMGASALARSALAELSPEEAAAQRKAAERHLAEREAEMKRRERDALIEKAALAILQGSVAAGNYHLHNAGRIWVAAAEFVDAREARGDG